MKRRYYLGTLLLGVLVIACNSGDKIKETESVKVRTLKIHPIRPKGVQAFSGTIEEMNGSTLSFSVNGTLKRILVTPGQTVKKGALIGTVDDISIRNAHNAATASLVQAKDAYKRMKLLHDNGSLPDIKWVEVQSKLEQAKAIEQVAGKNLRDCNLYAPYNGVISEKNVEIGQNVMPGMPVAKIVKVNQVKVKIAVPENEIAKININQTASVAVSALKGQEYKGHVIEKGITANVLSRSYEVKLLVDNSSMELMPGMICEVNMDKETEKSIYVIPAHIIQLDEYNHSFVWINKNNQAIRRFVDVGNFINEGIEIKSGLNDGDEVLIEGQQKVSENTSIEIIR